MREGQKRDAARALRRNSTDVERVMWRLLRDRRLEGIKFRRQVPIGPFVADFASISHRIVIELDGSQHVDNSSDARRDAFLASEGWRVLRFWNNDVTGNRDGVLESIAQAAALTRLGPSDLATLSRKRERNSRVSPLPLAGEGGQRSWPGESKCAKVEGFRYPRASSTARSEIFDQAAARSRKAR